MTTNQAQEEIFALVEKVRLNAERELIKAYATALKNVNEQITFYFNKFEQDGVLSYAELQQANRLQNIQEQIKEELRKPTLQINKSILKAIDEVYKIGTANSAFFVDMATGKSLSWGLFNTQAVKESIAREAYLKEFLTDARARQIISIKDKITQAIIQGISRKDLVKMIEAAMGEGLASAKRIAATEITAIFGRAQTEIYAAAREQGINLNEVWSSGGDSKVRDSHKQQDGKRRQSDGLFHLSSGVTCTSPGNCTTAGESVNCRCAIVAEFPEYGIKYKPTMSYKKWLKKYKK
jgi:uncharacterized FlaG/YvyC family protein